MTVSLKTPREMNSQPGVSLWLYRVVRNEFWLNNAPQRVDARTRTVRRFRFVCTTW